MEWLYQTKQGDCWDLLAGNIYGSFKLGHILQKANPQYLNYIYFPAGITLIVPQLPTQAANNNVPLPPWAD